jgi:hypothetical protein
MVRSLTLAVLAFLCACDGRIYLRDGVTDGDTFYLGRRALHDPDPVLQSWVSYSLTRSTCQLRFGKANPARATSFGCELTAREHLLETWAELGRDGAAPGNAYLDELQRVRRAGHLDEYVWHYLRDSAWQAPPGLETGRFESWRQQHLPRHDPESRLIGFWGYRQPTGARSGNTSGMETGSR